MSLKQRIVEQYLKGKYLIAPGCAIIQILYWESEIHA